MNDHTGTGVPVCHICSPWRRLPSIAKKKAVTIQVNNGFKLTNIGNSIYKTMQKQDTLSKTQISYTSTKMFRFQISSNYIFPFQSQRTSNMLQAHKKSPLCSSFTQYPQYSRRTLALIRSDEQLKV